MDNKKKAIEWISNAAIADGIMAFVGSFRLFCNPRPGKMWASIVYLNGYTLQFRQGPSRKLLSKAKEDAIRIACELQMDHYTAIVKEMKNFGI